MFIILHWHQILTNPPPRNEEESNYLRFFPVRENKGLKIYFEKFCAERSTRKRKEAAKKNKWRVEVSFARSESEIIWKSASRSFFTTALLVNFLKYLEINYNCSYTLWRALWINSNAKTRRKQREDTKQKQSRFITFFKSNVRTITGLNINITRK